MLVMEQEQGTGSRGASEDFGCIKARQEIQDRGKMCSSAALASASVLNGQGQVEG